jgi:hypothetical protein
MTTRVIILGIQETVSNVVYERICIDPNTLDSGEINYGIKMFNINRG